MPYILYIYNKTYKIRAKRSGKGEMKILFADSIIV